MVLQFQVKSNIAIPESIVYIVPCDQVTIKHGTIVIRLGYGDVRSHRGGGVKYY